MAITPEQEKSLHHAEEVSRVLSNPAIREVFDDMRDENILAWRSIGTTVEQREYHWLMDRCIATMRDLFQVVLDNGTVTQDQIKKAVERQPDLDPKPEGE